MKKYGRERSGKLTLWLTGDWDSQGVDVENAEGEGYESGFREHNGGELREEEQIRTAPGPGFEGGGKNWGELHSG